MRKVFKGFLLLLFLLALGCIAYYIFGFNTVAVVCDLSFSNNTSNSYFQQLRRDFFSKQYKLKVVELENLNLTDQQLLEIQISKLNKYDLLILSPVTTTFCVQYELDVSTMLDHSLVVGLTKSDAQLFDITLDPSQIEVDSQSVDYRARYTNTNAQYVVVPDLAASLDSYINQGLDKTNKIKGTLVYEKRSIK